MRQSTRQSDRTALFAAIERWTPSGLSRPSGFRRWAVVLLAAIAVLTAAAIPAQAQDLSIADSAPAQEGSDVMFTVTLSGTSVSAVTVQYDTSIGDSDTAAAGDFTPASGQTLTIAAGTTTGTITVATGNDSTDEDDETFTVTLSSPSSNATLGSPISATGTITDDDTRGVTVSTTSLTFAEQGSGTYTVKLNSQPTAEVTVAVAPTTGSDTNVSAEPTSLTFSTTNWSTAQTVTVSAAADSDVDDDTATIQHTVTGGDYEGVPADSVSVTVTDNTPPGKVTGVMVEARVEGLYVTWNQVDNADGYKIQWKEATATDYPADNELENAGKETAETSISPLTAGTAYTVRVIATRTGADDGVPSDAGMGTPLAAPPGQVMGVTATPAVESLVVGWTAAINADGYKVQWKLSSELITAYEANEHKIGSTLTDTITGLTPGTSYDVQVIATREHADPGDPSATVMGTPRAAAPGQVTDVTATPAVGSLVVGWMAATNAGGYKVQWRLSTETDEDYDTNRQRKVPGGATVTETIPSLDHTLTYTVRVIATRAHANDGMPSSPGVAARPLAPKPAQVTNVTAVKTTTVGELKVDWTAVNDADGYKVQWKLSSEPITAYDDTPVPGGSTLTYTLTGLAEGTEHAVRVIAMRDNTAGDGDPSDPATGTPRETAPAQVTGVTTAKTTTVGELKVDWTAVGNADGYKVQWRLGSEADEDYDTTRQETVPGGSTLTYTIPDLTGATAYTVRVTATREHSFDGTPSDGETGTPRAAPPGPLAYWDVALDIELLEVEWDSVPSADGYEVQWKAPGEDYDAVDRQIDVEDDGKAEIEPLNEAITYTIRMRATRLHADPGPWTDPPMTARPRAQTPAKVGTVTLTEGIRQLGISWPEVPDADGYKVQWRSGLQEYTTDLQHTITGGTMLTDTITPLTPGTIYGVQVIAWRDNAKDGDPSDERGAGPKAESPAKVTGLNVMPVVRGLALSWAVAPTVDGEAADAYEVQWKSGAQDYSDDAADGRQYTSSDTSTSYTIAGLDPDTTYTVQVRGTRTHADPGDWSEPPAATGQPMTDPPAKVAGLTLTREVRQLVVTWEQATNADGYTVQWRLGSETDADYDDTRQRTVPGGSTLTDTIPSLTPGTPYTVRVIARRDNAPDGDPSDAQTAVPKIERPGQVLNVAVTPQVEKLAVTWNAAANADGYTVQWKSGSEDYDPATREQRIDGGDNTSLTIPAAGSLLDHTLTYTVQVLARREYADDGDPSPEAMGRPRAPAPGQVTDVTVTPLIRELEVDWTAVDTADGYRVQWILATETSADYDATRQAVIGSGSTTSYTIPALDDLLTYTIRVTAARDNADDGPPSAETSGRPKTDPPTQPRFGTGVGIVASTYIELFWPVVAITADGYKVQWKIQGGQYDAVSRQDEVGRTTGLHRQYVHGLRPGTSYVFRLIATRNNADDSPPSEEVTKMTLGEAPAGRTTVTVTPQAGALAVSWTTVAGATRYLLQWKSGSQSYDSSRQQEYNMDSSTSHTITGLVVGTVYTVRVITTLGGRDEESPEVTGAPQAPPPGAVTGLLLTPQERRLAVQWTAATDADGYRVQWKSGGQDYNETDRQVRIGDGSTTTTLIPSLDPRVTYTVRVAATREAAADGTAAEESAAPLAAAPGQVTGLTAADRGDTVIRLVWEPPNDDGGADITGYRIEESDDGGTSDAWADLVPNTGTDGTTYDDAGLTPGTTRHYRVSAINSVDTGVPSTPDSATTRTQSNQTPVFVDGASASREIAENTAATAAVGAPLAATDSDNDPLTYSLAGADAASFTIDTGNGQLRILAAPDHEDRDTYAVTVTVTDLLDAEATIPVTITVTDVDEPPAAPAAPTVAAVAGQPRQLEVSWTAPDNAGRPDITSYALQYRAGDSGPFTEYPQDVADTDSATISATLEDLQPGTQYEVQVLARNDEGDSPWSEPGSGTTNAQPNRAPVFDEGTSATRSVAENTAADEPIGAPLTATDADNNPLTYSLQDAGAELFGIVPGSGQLLTLAALDFETAETHSVQVQVTDGTGGSAAITVTVAVADVDEPPAAPGEPVVTAISDTVDSLTVSWTAPGNTGPPITGYDLQYRVFGSGEDFVAGPQNVAETSTTLAELAEATVYEVQVLARNDEGQSPWSDSGMGNTGSATNATPEFAEGGSAERSVAENTAAGEAIGEPLTATDADADDTLTYALEGADAASFAIDADSGQLRTRAALDFETAAAYAVTVRADDGRGGSGRMAVTINVTDLVEPPDRPAAPTVAAVSGANDRLTVSWTAPGNTGPPITGYDLQYRVLGSGKDFVAGPQNVTETSTTLAELAEATVYEVQVLARNNEGQSPWSASGMGNTGSATNATPEFAEGGSAERSVAENTAAGEAIGEPLTATDADADDTLTYALEGADAASFAIDADSGQLRTRAALDFETATAYAVTVRADDGRGGSGRMAVTINVTDQAEPPDRPAAPTVAAVSGANDRLTVSWTAPGNTGPPITVYDLQYRVFGSGEDFIAGPQNVTETSTTLAELAAATVYEVQVLARNDEGQSPWSSPSTGRAGSSVRADTAVVTISAARRTAIAGLDTVSFDLTRTGATTDALSVTVTLSQTRDYLASTADQTVTFRAGSSTANLFFAASRFSSTASGVGTLTATVAAGDGYGAGTPGSASVSMSAVAGAAVTLKLSASSYSFNEDAAAANRQLTVVAEMAPGLAAPSVAITVSLLSRELGGTNAATAGTDFTSLSEQASIAPSAFRTENGRQVARLTQVLGIIDDERVELNETLEVRLGALPSTPAKVGFAQADGTACDGFAGTCRATVTIVNDDAALTVSPGELTIIEGGSATYTVVLTSQPLGDVTVMVEGASGDVSVNPTVLTFTANDWNDPQTVTVRAATDDDADTDASVTLTHTASGSGYDGLAANVVVRVEEVVRAVSNQAEVENEQVSEGDSKVFEVDVDDEATAEQTIIQVRVASGDLDDGNLQVTESMSNELQVRVSGGLLDGTDIRVPLSEDQADDTIEVSISLTDTGDGMVAEARETPPPQDVEPPSEPLVVDIKVPSGTYVCLPYDPAEPGTPVLYHFDGLQWERRTVMNQEVMGAQVCGTVTMASPFAVFYEVAVVEADASAAQVAQAWLARFNRTVADQVVEAVVGRLSARRGAGMDVIVAGRRVGEASDDAGGQGAWSHLRPLSGLRLDGDDPGGLGNSFGEGVSLAGGGAGVSQGLTERQLLTGSAFHLTAEGTEGGLRSLWGRGAYSRFDVGGAFSLDGDVSTGMVGADYGGERWLGGLVLSHSQGSGTYSLSGLSGAIESSLTGLYPYLSFALGERVSVWGVLGRGEGTLALSPDGADAVEADMAMTMAALGLRGELMPASASGLALALKADALVMRSTSDAAFDLAAVEADVSRWRFGLEGSRSFRLYRGGLLTPVFEVALRHDDGDAEVGTGVEVGGGIRYTGSALTLELKARGLLMHEAEEFRQWGMSGSLRYDPTPASERGLSASLTQSWGASATGGAERLWSRNTVSGMAAASTLESVGPLHAELGYGLSTLGGTGTPWVGYTVSDVGRDYRLGYRFDFARAKGADVGLSLEASRREKVHDGSKRQHGVMLLGVLHW